MPKKSFRGISPDNPAIPYFSKQDDHDGQDDHVVHDGQDRPVVHDGQDRPVVHHGQDRPVRQPTTDKAKCHINLRVSQELKDYLTNASWREHKNITQYLTDLIEADRMKAGERNV